MTTKRAKRGAPAKVGEGYTAVSLIGKKSLAGETPHHPAHRCGSEIETLRYVVRRDRHAAPTKCVERLEIVFDRTGERFVRQRIGDAQVRAPRRFHFCTPNRPRELPRTRRTGIVEACRTVFDTLPCTRSPMNLWP